MRWLIVLPFAGAGLMGVDFADELTAFSPDEVHRIMRANCAGLVGLATD